MQAFEHAGHGRIQRLHQAFSRSSCPPHHSPPPYCNRTLLKETARSRETLINEPVVRITDEAGCNFQIDEGI
ncbi:hypothetical protein, partial [Paraburkholderia domus]|uniref:hypothetical protein n=1 Tax=Paraburkholderia domus TaxID=2793075 RepID=UPI001BAD3716